VPAASFCALGIFANRGTRPRKAGGGLLGGNQSPAQTEIPVRHALRDALEPAFDKIGLRELLFPTEVMKW